MGIWDETAKLDHTIKASMYFLAHEACTDLQRVNQSSNFTVSDYEEKHGGEVSESQWYYGTSIGSDYDFSHMQSLCEKIALNLKDALSHKPYIITRYFLSHVVTPIIAAFSIVSNCLSLFFFSTKQRKSFVGKLFIFLNLLDLLLSLLAVLCTLMWNEEFVRDKKFSFHAYELLITSTAVVTAVIAFTRCLSVLKPFLSIKDVVVWVILAVLIGICTIFSALEFYITVWNDDLKEYLAVYINGTREISLPGLIIDSMNLILVLIVLISLIYLVSKLYSTSTDIESVEARKKRYAAKTVAILSVNFIVLNTLYACTQLLEIIYADEFGNIPDIILYPIIMNATVLIPLNSAINPVIYFTRNKKMREWLCGLARKSRGKLGCLREMSNRRTSSALTRDEGTENTRM